MSACRPWNAGLLALFTACSAGLAPRSALAQDTFPLSSAQADEVTREIAARTAGYDLPGVEEDDNVTWVYLIEQDLADREFAAIESSIISSAFQHDFGSRYKARSLADLFPEEDPQELIHDTNLKERVREHPWYHIYDWVYTIRLQADSDGITVYRSLTPVKLDEPPLDLTAIHFRGNIRPTPPPPVFPEVIEDFGQNRKTWGVLTDPFLLAGVGLVAAGGVGTWTTASSYDEHYEDLTIAEFRRLQALNVISGGGVAVGLAVGLFGVFHGMEWIGVGPGVVGLRF